MPKRQFRPKEFEVAQKGYNIQSKTLYSLSLLLFYDGIEHFLI
jgi:hypothetical protein